MKEKPTQAQVLNATAKAISQLFILIRSNDPDPCAVIWNKANLSARSYWLLLADLPPGVETASFAWVEIPKHIRVTLERRLIAMIEFFTQVGLHK